VSKAKRFSRVVASEVEHGPMTSRYVLTLACGHIQRALRNSIHNHKQKKQPTRVICSQCKALEASKGDEG
jgi:hypothetical protein